MNLNARKPVSEMSDQEIAYELKDFEWEYIALADWARSDAQYQAGEVYLNERKESLILEKELRARSSQLTPDAPDGATCAHENWTEVDDVYYCYDCKSVIPSPPII